LPFAFWFWLRLASLVPPPTDPAVCRKSSDDTWKNGASFLAGALLIERLPLITSEARLLHDKPQHLERPQLRERMTPVVEILVGEEFCHPVELFGGFDYLGQDMAGLMAVTPISSTPSR
jgi:hypothetical protein